jgi:preprotein translocase subunit SecD
VLQRRLEQFGAIDATVQESAGERLVVEASGVKELGRLEVLLLHVGTLEFRITDMHQRFRDALPEIDKTLRRAGVRVPRHAAIAGSVAQLFGVDTSKPQGGKGKAGERETIDLSAPGPLSSLLYQGPIPGEYLVLEVQVPVAESLLARPEVRRLIPRGLDVKWGTEVTSRGAQAYRALYAVEDRPIITGAELEKATARRDRSPISRCWTSSCRVAGGAFSSGRPAAG